MKKRKFIQTCPPAGQMWLFPPSVDEFVPKDAPVRAIYDVLNRLNWQDLADSYKETGRPAYDPADLGRAMLYGALIGVRSSRRLEEELTYDLRFKYLSNMASPDFRTIARFRRRHASFLASFLAQTIELGKEAGLIDNEDHAVDGTKIEANASKRSCRSEAELEAAIERAKVRAGKLLDEWENNDQRDETHGNSDLPEGLRDAKHRQEVLEQAQKKLQKRQSQTIVVSDPDSRMIKTSTGIRPAYNAQAVVDRKSQMIVAARVVQDESDARQFKPMVEAAKQNTGSHAKRVTADGGYWSKECLDYAQSEKGLDAYIAPSGVKHDTLEGWSHDRQTDRWSSPDGGQFVFEKERVKSSRRYRIYRNQATGESKWIPEDAEQLNKMRLKTTTPDGKKIYKKRQSTIEPVFAHIKGAIGLRRLLLRGLKGAEIEFTLACIAHNIGKLAFKRPAIAG